MAIGEEAERRISAEKVLRDALGYVRRQWKAMLLFTAAALGLILLSIKAGGIEGYGFWPVLVALYLLESVFFRFYFVNNREIYNLSKEYIRFCIYSFCYIDVFLKENLCDFSTCRTKSGLL